MMDSCPTGDPLVWFWGRKKGQVGRCGRVGAHEGRMWLLSLTGSMKLNLTHVKARIVCPSPFSKRENT